jgi:hypothetical protein
MTNVNQAGAIWDTVLKKLEVHKHAQVIQTHNAVNATEWHAMQTTNVNIILAIVENAMILSSGFLYSQAH